MSLKLRTISLLEEASELEDTMLFGISKQINVDDAADTADDEIGTKYTSLKVSYATLKNDILTNIEKILESKYNLAPETGKPINVAELYKTVHKLSAENCDIFGQKTFYSVPLLSPEIELGVNTEPGDQTIPSIKYVKHLIENNGDYITDDMVVVGAPGNNIRYTVFDRNFMHWKIGENQTDSSEYIDTTGFPVGPKVCTHTGNLVIYGWMADNGDVDPQDAWVGLYGCMHTNTEEDNERDWVLLQLLPWPLTSRSSIFQYVGFNVKVAKGLMLKIKTGFRVKGKNSGFLGGSSLTYWTNLPNSFVGYFITTMDEYSAV